MTAIETARNILEVNNFPTIADDALQALIGRATKETTIEKKLTDWANAQWEEQKDDSDDEEETVGQRMSKQLAAARVRYVDDRRPKGTKTQHNADSVARALNPLEPLEVARVAMTVIEDCPDLVAKYAHLNPGQIRMNSGNRIRSAWKNGDIDEAQLEAAIVAVRA